MRRLCPLLIVLSLAGCSGDKPRPKDDELPVTPLTPPERPETAEQKRARLERERGEVKEELTLLAGEGPAGDPNVTIRRCEQMRARIKKLVELGKELGEQTAGLEEILPRLDRLERLAKLKAGIDD